MTPCPRLDLTLLREQNKLTWPFSLCTLSTRMERSRLVVFDMSTLRAHLDSDTMVMVSHHLTPCTSRLILTPPSAGKFSPSTLQSIRSAPEIAYVEHDQVMHTTDVPYGVDDAYATTKKSADSAPGIVTALNSPWGLARISHRPRPRLSTFTKYAYDPSGGVGVTAYVIDTGINVEHIEFEGRAKWGKTIPKNDVDNDQHGHGTHCAGTIASKKYGVAKAAEVIAVKVLGSNGSGSMSDVVAGVM